jgi:hypothetical protein
MLGVIKTNQQMEDLETVTGVVRRYIEVSR